MEVCRVLILSDLPSHVVQRVPVSGKDKVTLTDIFLVFIHLKMMYIQQNM
jgi:hypothetical protein